MFAGLRECWLVIPEGNAKTTLAGGLVLYRPGEEPDGYAPAWLLETLPELVSPRRHWVDGVELSGFGASNTLEELRKGLA